MKRFFVIFCLFLSVSCYGGEINMNPNLEKGMEYILTEVIPKYYNGQLDIVEERNFMHRKYFVGLQGNPFFSMMRGTEDLIFNFYFLINHDYQSCQCIMLTDETVGNELYEYWIVNISDRMAPYNFAYFYLTKAESKSSTREIVDVSKKYRASYLLQEGTELDLSVRNLITLYQAEPWYSIESFKGTKYENMIVKWKKDEPYLRKMNIFEILYYKFLPKAKRD